MDNDRRKSRLLISQVDIIHRRLQYVGLFTCVIVLGVAVGLGVLQLGHRVQLQRLHTVTLKVIPANRGEILNRNLQPLVQNVVVGDISIDPTAMGQSETPDALINEINGYIASDDAAKDGTQTAQLDVPRLIARLTTIRNSSPKSAITHYMLVHTAVPYGDIMKIIDKQKSDHNAHKLHPTFTDDFACVNIAEHTVRAYPNKKILPSRYLALLESQRPGFTKDWRVSSSNSISN